MIYGREVLPTQGGCDFSAMAHERLDVGIRRHWFNARCQVLATAIPGAVVLMPSLHNAIAMMLMRIPTHLDSARRDLWHCENFLTTPRMV
jgi:hypothetical protein